VTPRVVVVLSWDHFGKCVSKSRSKNGSPDERRRAGTIRKRSLVGLKRRIPGRSSDIERVEIRRVVKPGIDDETIGLSIGCLLANEVSSLKDYGGWKGWKWVERERERE
jgi:hypothetical protein